MRRSSARNANSPRPARESHGRPAGGKRGRPHIRALIVGGGIGGLAAAVALQRVGVEAAVFEKAPEIAEVGAGLSLWSNALLALRRLGVETDVAAAGAVIDRTRSFLSSGKPAGEVDLGELGRKAGAPTVCAHRADLQRVLLAAATDRDPAVVQTGRECTGFEQDGEEVAALFADGTRERGHVLIGADGLHSAIRRQLFGDEAPRYAGYYAWRGIAHGAAALLPAGEALVVIARGSHAGCFGCGGGRVYWFLTRNGAANSRAGPDGNRAEALQLIEGWQGPLRRFIEATEDADILRNDIVDRPPRTGWGQGRVTLLGDAIHATTPNLGQGACQALEDAVILADSLGAAGEAEAEAGLRTYEARRRDRANFVINQSYRLGYLLQLANPLATRLRDAISQTALGRRQTATLLDRLLRVELPVLGAPGGNAA